jgi:hypothetical protein
MVGIYGQVTDVVPHSLLDAVLQSHGDWMSGPEKALVSLRAAAKRLLDMLAAVNVQGIELAVQVLVEFGHVFVAVRGLQIEDTHEFVVVAEADIGRVVHRPERNALYGNPILKAPVHRKGTICDVMRPLRLPRLKQGRCKIAKAGEIAGIA